LEGKRVKKSDQNSGGKSVKRTKKRSRGAALLGQANHIVQRKIKKKGKVEVPDRKKRGEPFMNWAEKGGTGRGWRGLGRLSGCWKPGGKMGGTVFNGGVKRRPRKNPCKKRGRRGVSIRPRLGGRGQTSCKFLGGKPPNVGVGVKCLGHRREERGDS